jgi:hypothetical protein
MTSKPFKAKCRVVKGMIQLKYCHKTDTIVIMIYLNNEEYV